GRADGARERAVLHPGGTAGRSEHYSHLQQQAEEVADGVGAMLGEALGAVAALEQEGLASRHTGKLRLQLPRLAGKDERRKGGKLLLDVGELLCVRIDRNLLDRLRAPTIWAPSRRHLQSLLEKLSLYRRFARAWLANHGC